MGEISDTVALSGLAGLAGYGGYKTLTDPRTLSQMTGTENLLHVTPSSNVPSILDNGLLVRRSYDPTTISHLHAMQNYAKGYIFTGRTRRPLDIMERIHKDTSGRSNYHKKHGRPMPEPQNIIDGWWQGLIRRRMSDPMSRLGIRIPYEDLGRLNPQADPAWTSMEDFVKAHPPTTRKEKIINSIFRYNSRAFSPNHTYAFPSDIPPEYIQGSPRFENGFLSQVRRFPKYVANNPGRFLKGAGKFGAGLALLGLMGYGASKAFGS